MSFVVMDENTLRKWGGAGMKANREDVVQAALKVERWCKENRNSGLESCDCPFSFGMACSLQYFEKFPNEWNIEEHLRKRGLDDV